MRFTVTAALAVVLLVAAPAEGQIDRDWRARAGIEKAKRAGVMIDPAAEAAMARAPVGSCPNDPTQAKCPVATAIVASDNAEGEGGWETYAGGGGATATPSRGGLAQARAAYIPQCQMRVTEQSPFKAAGYAQMTAQNECSAAVTTHELYAVLRKFYSGSWYQMSATNRRGPGGVAHYINLTYGCTKQNVLRAWEAHAEGWALLKGTWYLGTQTRHKNLYCG